MKVSSGCHKHAPPATEIVTQSERKKKGKTKSRNCFQPTPTSCVNRGVPNQTRRPDEADSCVCSALVRPRATALVGRSAMNRSYSRQELLDLFKWSERQEDDVDVSLVTSIDCLEPIHSTAFDFSRAIQAWKDTRPQIGVGHSRPGHISSVPSNATATHGTSRALGSSHGGAEESERRWVRGVQAPKPAPVVESMMRPAEAEARPSVTDEPPPGIDVDDAWHYKDPAGRIHGPYSTEQMKVWNNKRFFTLDLPVRHGNASSGRDFVPLGDVYHDLDTAFSSIPNAWPGRAAAETAIMAERAAAAAEEAARKQAEAERARAAAAAAAADAKAKAERAKAVAAAAGVNKPKAGHQMPAVLLQMFEAAPDPRPARAKTTGHATASKPKSTVRSAPSPAPAPAPAVRPAVTSSKSDAATKPAPRAWGKPVSTKTEKISAPAPAPAPVPVPVPAKAPTPAPAPLQALTKKQKQKLKKKKLKQQKLEEQKKLQEKAKEEEEAQKAPPQGLLKKSVVLHERQPEPDAHTSSPKQPSATVPAWGNQRVQVKTLREIQEEEERNRKYAPPSHAAAKRQTLLSSSAWGSSATRAGPSLKEIQEEEQKRSSQQSRSSASRTAASVVSANAGRHPVNAAAPSTREARAATRAPSLKEIQTQQRAQKAQSESISTAKAPREQPAPRNAGAWGPQAAGTSAKPTKSLAEIQADEARSRPKQPATDQDASETLRNLLGVGSRGKPKSSPPRPANSTWSRPSSTATNLRAIQAEEARQKQLAQRNRPKPSTRPGASPPRSSGWAASSRSGPSLTQIQAQQAEERARQSRAAPGSWGAVAGARRGPAATQPRAAPSSNNDDLFWTMSDTDSSNRNSEYPSLGGSNSSDSEYPALGGSNSSKSDGKSMPPSMLAWCKKKLLTLTASDNCTLVHYVSLMV